MTLHFMSGYLHRCVHSCLQSADSCSNTIKDNVIRIITSVKARRCAYRSTADSSNSNTPWSRTPLQLPFRYGSVCKRQRNVLQSVQHFQTKTLVFPLLVCQTRIPPPIFRPCDAFLYRLMCLRLWLLWAGRCCCTTMVMSIGENPTTHQLLLDRISKGHNFYLLIPLDQTSCLKCEHKRTIVSWRLAFTWRNDKLQCVLEAEGSAFIHLDGSGGGLSVVKCQSCIIMVHFNVCLQ